MIDFQKNIDNAFLTLKSAYDNETLRPIVRYEIYSAQANDQKFRLAHHESTDISNFKKNVKNIIENFGSDAIQIKIFAGKKPDLITIKITDTFCELTDGKKEPVITPERNERREKENDYSASLGAIETLRSEVTAQKHDNEIRFLKQEHEFSLRKKEDEIEKLKDEIYTLKSDLAEADEENAILVESIEEIQAEIESQPDDNSAEVMKLKAIITGVGKIAGLKNDEISELAGILDSKDSKTNEPAQAEKDGGLVEENEDTANLSDADKVKAGLVKWINNINDKNLLDAIAWILTVISDEISETKNADIVNDVIDFLSEKLGISDNEEKIDTSNPE